MKVLLDKQQFVRSHRQSENDFVRQRKLPFKAVVLLILAKSTKSLQVFLNEAAPKLGVMSVTNRAYSKARSKLSHGVFVELNQLCVLPTVYEDKGWRSYRGMRVLAVDGSKIHLPNTKELGDSFGLIKYRNEQGVTTHPGAMASVLYDVLNDVSISADLHHVDSYEADLAKELLGHVKKNDLVIYDRGYCSFAMIAAASSAHGHFLIRCHKQSFSVARQMLGGDGPDDQVVELAPTRKTKDEFKDPVKVRFVRVVLDTGEIEVLVTSLLDQKRFPASDFRDLYWNRWGIETFFGVLKGRLDLENFTGHSTEAVLQDFHASVLLCGMESIFSEDINESLAKKSTEHTYKVNKAVAFNSLKDNVFELFLNDTPTTEVVAKLDVLFATNPVCKRPGRDTKRFPPSAHRSFNFMRRRRKAVY